MKFGILSDVHANLEALEVALKFLRDAEVDEIVFLGDAVGYGPNPNEVCELLRDNCLHACVGNHDAAVIGTLDTTWFHPVPRHSRWTGRRRSLSPSMRAGWAASIIESRSQSSICS